jgi:hypothetical protein
VAQRKQQRCSSHLYNEPSQGCCLWQWLICHGVKGVHATRQKLHLLCGFEPAAVTKQQCSNQCLVCHGVKGVHAARQTLPAPLRTETYSSDQASAQQRAARAASTQAIVAGYSYTRLC